jgi:hypothetical protein
MTQFLPAWHPWLPASGAVRCPIAKIGLLP